MAQYKIDENNVLVGITLGEGETTVKIPDGVVKLDEWLFNKQAKNITMIDLPDSLEDIGDGCFFDCTYL